LAARQTAFNGSTLKTDVQAWRGYTEYYESGGLGNIFFLDGMS
jgi:hypothetical protein